LAAPNAEDEVRALLSLCREQLEHIWAFVDKRDDTTAEYIEMIQRGVRKTAKEFSTSNAIELGRVVQAVLDKRLSFDALQKTRLRALVTGATTLPSPSIDEALEAEAAELELDGSNLADEDE